MLVVFLSEFNSKGLYQSSGKEKESSCLVFPSLTKREIRHSQVLIVVVQRRLRNVQKSVIHVQDCCFAKYKPIAFLPFSLLNLPIEPVYLKFKN